MDEQRSQQAPKADPDRARWETPLLVVAWPLLVVGFSFLAWFTVSNWSEITAQPPADREHCIIVSEVQATCTVPVVCPAEDDCLFIERRTPDGWEVTIIRQEH